MFTHYQGRSWYEKVIGWYLNFFTICRLLGVKKILGVKLSCLQGYTWEVVYLLMRLSSTFKYIILCFLPNLLTFK